MPAAMKAAVTSRVLRASSAGPPQTSDALRDRVHVDDAIDAVMGFLHLHEVDDRAEVIAEMQIARRLDAGKNLFNKSHSQLPEDACFALFVCHAGAIRASR